jgi:hypothetical protein
MITQVNDRVWTATSEFKVFGLIQLNGRCTIIKCNDGSLWVHSPIRLSQELKAQVDVLGPIKYLVAPSLFHHLFVGEWLEAYPEAEVYAPKGLHKKQPNLDIAHTLTHSKESYAWSEEIDHVFLAGMPAVNEYVFYDKPSQTVIITDLCFYFPQASGFTKLYLNINKVYQQLNTPLLFKSVIKDQTAFKASVAELKAWEVQYLSLCHHAVLTGQDIEHWHKYLAQYEEG